jgi:hypothetical protein
LGLWWNIFTEFPTAFWRFRKLSMSFYEMNYYTSSVPPDITIVSSLILLMNRDSLLLQIVNTPCIIPKNNCLKHRNIQFKIKNDVENCIEYIGIYLTRSLPKRRTLNSEYDLDTIRILAIWIREQVDGRLIVLHANDTRLHVSQKPYTFCAENDLPLVTQPLDLPDLTSSDFSPFAYI